MSARPTDHYRALGVSPTVSTAEIRSAYLRLMRRYHPDRRPGDAHATAMAQAANAAWSVLGDSRRRAAYDRLHAASPPLPVTARRAGPAGAGAAYSPARRHYRRAFSLACLRIGGAVLAVGAAVLFSLG